ncbi:MAG: hypothetical protein ACRDJE_05095 [Dehalococcoidia bacterium]
MTALNLPAPPRAAFGPPIAVLIEPSPSVRDCVTGLLEPQGFCVCVADGPTADLEQAAFVLVEADRRWRAKGLIRRIRSEHPGLPVAGVLPWWDDDEDDVRGLACFILHVPVREDQLQGLSAVAAAARGP